jgi:FKBP-type peptidyl-prolyl cis-trans isomerase FkpA
MKKLSLVVLSLAAFACGGQDAETDDAFVPAAGSRPAARPGPIPEVASDYAAELNVDLGSMTVMPTGVRFRDLVVGTGGEAAPGHSVVTNYTGWLADGRQFDSGTHPPRGGNAFVLGAGDVIAGWDHGIVGMRVGGKRQLVLPPSLGYGEAGSRNVIPGGATLVFEVELVSTGN